MEQRPDQLGDLPLSEAHAVNFFAPDRPTGGTVYDKPEIADEADEHVDGGPSGFEVKFFHPERPTSATVFAKPESTGVPSGLNSLVSAALEQTVEQQAFEER